jgi:hypothetical protein
MPRDNVLAAFRAQWQQPGDVLSLLLLVGGDVIQQALAQLVGVRFRLFKTGHNIYVTPVAFSFGWVAYAFSSLVSIFGDRRLMPNPDTSIIVLNCDNGYVRDNNSWVLGRLVRDHEASVEVAAAFAPLDSSGKPRSISLKIDIFIAKAIDENQSPTIGKAWFVGWAVIAMQHAMAAFPWVKYGDWAIFMVTICGTAFALFTGALPQWTAEKWSAGRLHSKKKKTIALTRGNGHQYVMVIVGHENAWDLEAMSSARLKTRSETRWAYLALAALWTLLLITVSGLKAHSWFLIGVGGLGMLQNIYVAAAIVEPEELNIRLEPHQVCSTIIGFQMEQEAKKLHRATDPASSEEDEDDSHLAQNMMERPSDVMGALMELEKLLPKVGASLLSVFFPGGVEYEPARLYSNREKKFWKSAFRRMGKPVPRKVVRVQVTAPKQAPT